MAYKVIPLVLLLAGCSIEPVEYSYYDEGLYEESEDVIEDDQVSDEDVLTATSKRSQNVKIDAYAKVAEQILWDWRGKMHAVDGFRYVKPIRKCGVQFDGHKYGHAIIAPYTGCVDIAPGHYVDEATVYIPKVGGNDGRR